jgi:hypothetical protein
LPGQRIDKDGVLWDTEDVHEHAVIIIHQLLAEAGADMINLGAEADPIIKRGCVAVVKTACVAVSSFRT